MDSGSRYFDPLVNTSCREMLFTMLRSPVIMWPARLYMNGELAHEVVNIEILQHMFVIKYLSYNRCSISIQDYRNILIFKIGRNFRFD
jgi:hypothetical protein